MTDGAIPAGEHVEGGDLGTVGEDAEIIARIGAVEVAVEPEVLPPPLPLPRDEPREGRAGDHGQRNALADVGGVALPGTQEIGANRAGAFTLGAEHVAVDGERLPVAEQAGKIDDTLFALEAVIAGHGATRRQGAPLCGHSFDVTAQFDFLGEQGCPRRAVFGTLVADPDRVAARELRCGRKVF
jgi:hypothetical protein